MEDSYKIRVDCKKLKYQTYLKRTLDWRDPYPKLPGDRLEYFPTNPKKKKS